MSALDTAKEIVRMGSTAGLSKDVIDLLEKKLAILTDELSKVHGRIAQLEIENGQLRAQLKQPRQLVKLDETSRKALQYFCERNAVVTVPELAQHLSCPVSKAQFFCDGLSSKAFIRVTSLPNTDQRWEALEDNSGYEISPDGRKFCYDNEG